MDVASIVPILHKATIRQIVMDAVVNPTSLVNTRLLFYYRNHLLYNKILLIRDVIRYISLHSYEI
jgi:hypothetical protein